MDVPVEEVFHQVQGGQVAVLMVDKLEQALVEEGGQVWVLLGQLGQVVP